MSRYVSPENKIRMSLRLPKVPNSRSSIYIVLRHTVCETCKIHAAQANILFPFIFIVTFSDRLLSSKMWFFFLGTWTGRIFQPFEQEWFQWLNLISIFQFFGWTPCFMDISDYPQAQKKNNFSCSLTDPTELSLGWAWFSFLFTIYFHYMLTR